MSVTVLVVIPALNAADFLRDAARSVLAQTHSALELVIVDDGSNDRTLGVARGIEDPRVRVISLPNGGVGRARNAGIAASLEPPLIAFLDADDLWDADKLEMQLAWLDAHPDAIAVGSFMRYISSGGRVLGETGDEIDENAMEKMRHAELAPFPISSCIVVRRAALDAIGGFDSTVQMAEDLEFIAQLARQGAIGCIPRPLGSYRIHPRSMMAQHRFEVNRHARFVRERLRMRDSGRELTWETFNATYAQGWGERRRDWVEHWYRSAALWHGERNLPRALGYGALAMLGAPAYTLRRVWRQRIARRDAAFR